MRFGRIAAAALLAMAAPFGASALTVSPNGFPTTLTSSASSALAQINVFSGDDSGGPCSLTISSGCDTVNAAATLSFTIDTPDNSPLTVQAQSYFNGPGDSLSSGQTVFVAAFIQLVNSSSAIIESTSVTQGFRQTPGLINNLLIPGGGPISLAEGTYTLVAGWQDINLNLASINLNDQLNGVNDAGSALGTWTIELAGTDSVVIPLPAGFLLILTALAGLGFLGRKRMTA